MRLLKLEEESKGTAIISLISLEEENGDHHSMREEFEIENDNDNESVHTQIIESEYSEELNLNLDDGSFRNSSFIRFGEEPMMEQHQHQQQQEEQEQAPLQGRSQRSQEMAKAVNQKTRLLLVVVLLNLLLMVFLLKNRRV